MKFLVDSAVSPEVAEGLRRSGHDTAHTVDCGLASANDEDILMRAAIESRVVVTSDTDFGELLAQNAAKQPSVILFRRTSGKPSEENLLLAKALAKPESPRSVGGWRNHRRGSEESPNSKTPHR